MYFVLGGTTLHTGLDFKWGREFYPLDDEKREQLRSSLEDLQVIVFDEISMMSTDMLYMIHKRLCEIFVSDDPFAGKAILLVGDLLQLRPVKARYIFEKPKNPKFHPLYQVDSLWRQFKPIILKTNFRQGEGSDFNSILNRARFGEMTPEDLEKLESCRLNPKKHRKIIAEAFHVFWTNEETELMNLKKLNQLPTPIEVIKANIIAPKGYTAVIKKHGTVDDTQFRKILKLGIDARVMLTFNVNIGDSLINGSIGTVVDFVKTNGAITAVMVVFDDEESGIAQREANRHLKNDKYPNATPIFKTSLEYLARNRKSGSVHGCRIKITQFALKLAWASTCHKIQGVTMKKGQNLIAHGHENIPPAMQYVMMGRVSNIENLYISENFDLKKVRPQKKALAEQIILDEMFSKTTITKYDIFFVNIRSLRHHQRDLLGDLNAQNSNLLCLSETWIYPDDEEEADWIDIPNKNKTLSCVGRGKGCCVYYDNDQCLRNINKFISQKFQIISGIYKNCAQIFVLYISKGADFDLIVNTMKNMMIPGPKIVIGDFNYESTKHNALTLFLNSKGLIQIVNRPTHIEGGIIDHCYVEKNMMNAIKIDYIYPYYSDHISICLSISQHKLKPIFVSY